jgi:hypothetical protein
MSELLGQIPELIQAISNLARPKTSVALMLSCRSYFDLLAPLLWENLTGAEILLSLIDGAKTNIGTKIISIVSYWHAISLPPLR